MTRSILASLTGLSSDRAVLETAIALARVEGGQILALRARIDVVDAAAVFTVGFPDASVPIADTLSRIREEENTRSRHARTAYEEAMKRIGGGGGKENPVILAWAETTSLFAELIAQARYHDITVMGRDPELSAEGIRTVLQASGRPLLLAPPKPAPLMGKTIAIAWKEGAEAARAVTAAETLLARADRIVILCAPEGVRDQETARSADFLAALLARRGWKAEIRMGEAGGGARAIRNLAYECDADLLVMGAYGHSRMREFLLGGMTEAMLADCAIPVFLFH